MSKLPNSSTDKDKAIEKKGFWKKIFESEKELDEYFYKYAKNIESNTDLFPNKINVNGVWKISENIFGQKTYERGVGLTLACGTGASATFTYLCNKFLKLKNEQVEMKILGGKLFFEYSIDNEIFMTGKAKKVFDGDII
jgi:diaminopimelate epimerase